MHKCVRLCVCCALFYYTSLHALMKIQWKILCKISMENAIIKWRCAQRSESIFDWRHSNALLRRGAARRQRSFEGYYWHDILIDKADFIELHLIQIVWRWVWLLARSLKGHGWKKETETPKHGSLAAFNAVIRICKLVYIHTYLYIMSDFLTTFAW